ncbi:metal tolerance protein 4 isoform X1 [Selaginella moellendorffii]|uniref:metal tolerance protein 4 isoform X1 n=1 Tax=Selaginella moellendorffii TaxID=88036 RepID=UPI000D1CFAB5|nr:metal tolerance protein 4 isoform X1 [Selaginella moellendorffii]|eukprot:XP_002972349.2 metal tolerance protein 4 isoform X1 [Selaginella moellendorffii]
MDNVPLLQGFQERRECCGRFGSCKVDSGGNGDRDVDLERQQHTVICKLSRFQYYDMLTEEAFEDSSSPHQNHGIREYNKKQREALAMFEEVDALSHLGQGLRDDGKSSADREALAVNCSNLWNVILLALKVYATVASGSLAIAASTLDSLLDLLAGGILWFTQWTMKRTDIYNYPIGKLRVQPVGIVVFAAVMATLGLQVLIEGVRQLLDGKPKTHLDMSQSIWMIAIMGTAIVVKLGLFLYCRSFKDEIILAYAMDHQFDVITNVVGLAAALLADRFYWWLDPIGAVALAIYTIVNWSKTVFENAVSLIGKSAPPEVLQKLTYMAFNHHRDIQHIDTVRAYTFGALFFVEVDIQLPETMPLKEAHDIGQSLQDKIEALAEVERAFVHLDFECTHKPEHQKSHFITDV